VAVLGLTHPSKSVTKAMNAATGSQAFVAAARATWLFTRETDENGQETGRTLMLPVKNNLSARRHNGMAYRIAGFDLGNGISAPYVVWDGEPINITADQALAMAMEPGGDGGNEDRTATDDAIGFLSEVLKAVPSLSLRSKSRRGRQDYSALPCGRGNSARRGKSWGIEAYQPGGEKGETGSPGWVWFLGNKSAQGGSDAL
jgi:hypothetical protein